MKMTSGALRSSLAHIIRALQFTSRRRFATEASCALEERYARLQDEIPHVDFNTNRYDLERHGQGDSSHQEPAPPDVIVTPTCVEDIRAILKYCMQHRIPVIPYGSGTSGEGEVHAIHGGLSLDTRLLQDMELPDMNSGDTLPDPIATVGAGVTRNTLNTALRHSGMYFSVDPGADATLGGMVATGASGTTTVKYGAMRENLLGVECVLADEDATVVRAGTRALKNSAGYDLLSLMCGSEGTLGVITSVMVKLHPVPHHVVAAICVFDSVLHAAQAVAALKLTEVPLSRCELLDASSVEAFNTVNKDAPPMETKPTLFLELSGATEVSLQEDVSMTRAICVDDYGGSSFDFKTEEEERRALWAARHNLYYAGVASRPGATRALVTDACVPLSQFAALIDATTAYVEKMGVQGPCFGHAGDGNFHCILPFRDDDSEEYLQKLRQVNEYIIDQTLRVGGTCTGEHGIGYGKIKYLKQQYGPGAPRMMSMIKKSLDRYNILNPGKVVSSHTYIS